MIIYSWNMLFANQKLDDAFDFIASCDFDIFCLQEVPAEFLPRLQSLPCFFASIDEWHLHTASRTFLIHSVILSKYPIQHTEAISFPDRRTSLLTRFTRYLLNLLSAEKIIKRDKHTAFFADVLVDSRMFRVFNFHLPLSYPLQRMSDFIHAMKQKQSADTVVCGDFNILERFYIALLNWLLGGSLLDWFLFWRERKNMEAQFSALELSNPLVGKSTHPISRSQLDHVLVPATAKVMHREVLTNAHGSDHCPLRVQIEF
jgi:endonuclease/exonuclease/phosphatase family metal-dependent hydrolase